MGYWVAELCVELIDEALDQPVAVDGIVYDLLHGSADGEEVLVFFILEKNKTTISDTTASENEGSNEELKYQQPVKNSESRIYHNDRIIKL